MGLAGFTIRVNSMTGKNYTREEVDKQFRQPLFEPYPKIREWMNRVAANFEDGKTVAYTRLGRRRMQVPDVPALLNTPVQAGALDVMKAIAVAIYEGIPPNWSIIGIVHDEVLVEVPEHEAKDAEKAVHEIMVRVGREEVNRGVPVERHVAVDAGTKICASWDEKE
jgi:DNA polymerase-1